MPKWEHYWAVMYDGPNDTKYQRRFTKEQDAKDLYQAIKRIETGVELMEQYVMVAQRPATRP